MDFTMFDIYLIMTADSIHGFLLFLSILTGIIAVVRAGYCVLSDQEVNHPYTWGKYFVVTCFVLSLVTVFMPSTRTLVAMYGITSVLDVAENISENENVNELGDKSFKALNHLLDSYINDQQNQNQQ